MTGETGPEEVLTGGGGDPVVRIGDRVHRLAGPWTPAVHRWLRHLRAAGFTGAPTAHGHDAAGREVLDFLPGVVPGYPVPDWAWTDAALVAAGDLLGRLHVATTGFDPEGPWRQPTRQPAEVVCHNDAAPYNMVFRDGLPVALIDFDHASPGPRAWDLAYLAYRMVPIAHAGNRDLPAWPHEADRGRRLDLLVAAYAAAAAPLEARLGRAPSAADVLAVLPDRLEAIAASAVVPSHVAYYLADAAHARRVTRPRTAPGGPTGPH